MDLKEEIRKLIELQEIDSRIYSLSREKDLDKPSALAGLKEDFETSKSTLSSIEEELKKLQLKRKEKELDLSSKEENIRKSQTQLYQLKTNKEYQAKLSEINSLKADISVIEDDVIKVLDEIEKKEDELNGAKARLGEHEKIFKDNQKKINDEIRQLESEINSLYSKRDIISKDVDPKILSVYERLIKTRSGLAIASVDDYNCSACHMRVTAQTINEIKMYKDLVFCEMCVRILYIKDDFQ